MKFIARSAGIWMGSSVLWAAFGGHGPAWWTLILLLLNAVLSLPVSGIFLARRPSTRGGAIALGLLGGPLPGIGLVVWGYSLGIAASCCGASTGFLLFALGVQAALTGLLAGLGMGFLWPVVRKSPRLQP